MQYTNADSNPQLLPSISSLNPLQSPAHQFPSTLRHLHETIHVVMSNKKITSYIGCGDLNSAMEVFLNMKMRTTVTWNSILFGFSSKPGKLKEAKDLFDKIPKPDTVSYNVMLACYFKNASVEAAKDFFYWIPIKDITSWNIISGFSQNGRMDDAKELFRAKKKYCDLECDDIGENNLVTWNAMIAGYVKNGTSLISMYCKRGFLEDGWKLFMGMSSKDVVTWNAMISGYAQHGVSDKALYLFYEMRNTGMKPDWITFVGVLSACNHSGLVDLGIYYFEKMQNDYGIIVKSDHYTCVIDLLGRAGKLTEAVDLIKNMPLKPHSAIYGTLLSACRIHKNLEIAEFAATNLLNLDPVNPVAYVQLANVYAAKKNWEDVSRIRRSMKENMVIKTPRCSWIEIKSVIYEFRSGDRLHSELVHIHDKLIELEKKMKLTDYVPNLESALHDVSEEQKQQLLLLHSEKLAIAFGLIKVWVYQSEFLITLEFVKTATRPQNLSQQ
ncbi:UNVERIFIED_CONTAM: Pentatricopeptide repeat-containing protein, mitochondrial [Sesamum angustifolium]|uniref:Pentatricopeptide repeat-containing protein, mitochondrial n=1 Tax=Sesamum angustifolium TaxID=2727405 RepID=A0AAW2M7V9_9LAMI